MSDSKSGVRKVNFGDIPSDASQTLISMASSYQRVDKAVDILGILDRECNSERDQAAVFDWIINISVIDTSRRRKE
jgi:hypothetical protein